MCNEGQFKATLFYLFFMLYKSQKLSETSEICIEKDIYYNSKENFSTEKLHINWYAYQRLTLYLRWIIYWKTGVENDSIDLNESLYLLWKTESTSIYTALNLFRPMKEKF